MSIFDTIQNNNVLKYALIAIVVYFIYTKYYKETLENTVTVTNQPLVQPDLTLAEQASVPVQTPEQTHLDSIIAGQTQLTTQDLLPKYDSANDFTKQNPVSQLLQQQNFLQAGYHHGINTNMESNKIQYLDLRSCPPIPKNNNISPWQNSSYESPAGAGRRSLE